MLLPWEQIRRFLSFRRHIVFDSDDVPSEFTGHRIDEPTLTTMRRAVYAVSRVARQAIAAGAVTEPSTSVTAGCPYLRVVDAGFATEAFRECKSHPTIDDLTDVFLPTLLLYSNNVAVRDGTELVLEDAAEAGNALKALTVGGGAAGRQGYQAIADLFFLPPALRGEGHKRSRWIRSTDWSPPRWGERGGPYWRIGSWNFWRLDVLSWSERLVLAGLIGTGSETAVALATPEQLPQVGWVPQTAQSLNRRLLCVPFDTCPRELGRSLRSAQVRQISGANFQRLLRVIEEVF